MLITRKICSIINGIGANHMQKTETEESNYQCDKMQQEVHLTFITRSSYSGENLIRKIILKKDCSARLKCGITPKLSATLWGQTDWESCEYLCRQKDKES